MCDRESDIYDFFKLSKELESPVVVRASADRAINKKSRYAEKDVVKIWEHMGTLPEAGSYEIDVPRKSKSKHCPLRLARTATVVIRFGSFRMNPPRNHPKQRPDDLPDLKMNAIHVLEENLSGRRGRYLTIMSIVAWPLFMIALIARTDPNQCCSSLLTRRGWKILFRRTHRNNKIPQNPPTIKEAVAWITRLEGHRGRKCDGPPWDDHPLERMEATYGFMRGRRNCESDNLYLWVM
ncbi:MAG: hypothetical protein ACI8UZ_001578 [Akkermansiaceae bacterium]